MVWPTLGSRKAKEKNRTERFLHFHLHLQVAIADRHDHINNAIYHSENGYVFIQMQIQTKVGAALSVINWRRSN